VSARLVRISSQACSLKQLVRSPVVHVTAGLIFFGEGVRGRGSGTKSSQLREADASRSPVWYDRGRSAHPFLKIVEHVMNRSLALVVFAVLASLLTVNQGLGQNPNEDLTQFIKSKWQGRYGKIKSVEFTLEIKESIDKGFFSSFPGPRLPGLMPGAVSPMADAFHESKQRYVIDGQKLCTESSGAVYVMREGLGEGWRDRHEKQAFDGKETRVLNEYKVGEAKLQGWIHAGRQLMCTEGVDANPIKCWLGPLLGSQFDLENVKGVVNVDPDKLPDEIVEAQYQNKYKISFDSTCNYMLAGINAVRDGKGWTLEVVNGIHENTLWYPMYWKFVQDFNGVKRVHEFTLKNLKINPKVETSQFEITFPPGTSVLDYTQGAPVQSVVKPDGSLELLPLRTRKNARALN
jgi:hypothetical protein